MFVKMLQKLESVDYGVGCHKRSHRRGITTHMNDESEDEGEVDVL